MPDSTATQLYSLMVGSGLALLTMIGCVAMLLGWFFFLQTKLRRSRDHDEQLHDLPPISPGAWGEPDLAPPSTSAVARAEATQLEALWSLPPHHASTGTD